MTSDASKQTLRQPGHQTLSPRHRLTLARLQIKPRRSTKELLQLAPGFGEALRLLLLEFPNIPDLPENGWKFSRLRSPPRAHPAPL